MKFHSKMTLETEIVILFLMEMLISGLSAYDLTVCAYREVMNYCELLNN